MRNWTKFRGLTSQERKLLIQALVLLPIVHILLKFIGYVRTVQVIEKQIPVAENAGHISQTELINYAQEAARMISIAATHGLYRATCLRRSLVLIVLLRRQGIEGRLCFGARLHDQDLEAHAWVEMGSIVINDCPDIRQQYTPLEDKFPSTQVGL